MTAQTCGRDGCNRQVWKQDIAFCSSICHFAVNQLNTSEVAARKRSDVDAGHKWFAAAVTLGDLLNEITGYKTEYYNAIGKGKNGEGSSGQQARNVLKNRPTN